MQNGTLPSFGSRGKTLMSEFISETNKAQLQIHSKVRQQISNLKFDEIKNSISHIEDSLDKYIETKDEEHLRNVYWHIGAIKAASQF